MDSLNSGSPQTSESARTYQLVNSAGTAVEVTNIGCRVMRFVFNGIDIVQGFDTAEEYLPERHLSDFGAVVGRYANRLADGRISIEGETVQLPRNNGPNCLHGGPRGWQYSLFSLKSYSPNRIEFTLHSPDGDNGFPGNVDVGVTYTLTDDNALEIDYCAESDRTTVLNLTNHSYFNLGGDLSASIDNHLLQIDADRYTPVNTNMIPIGDHASVAGTPFDFRTAKPIGRDIGLPHPQLIIGCGYDHNYALNRPSLDQPSATLSSPASGIAMEVHTTAPGMQLYTGNFLDGVVGKEGKQYGRRSAVCLETQQYPDSPNHHWAESPGYLYPGIPFKSTTVFKLRNL